MCQKCLDRIMVSKLNPPTLPPMRLCKDFTAKMPNNGLEIYEVIKVGNFSSHAVGGLRR